MTWWDAKRPKEKIKQPQKDKNYNNQKEQKANQPEKREKVKQERTHRDEDDHSMSSSVIPGRFVSVLKEPCLINYGHDIYLFNSYLYQVLFDIIAFIWHWDCLTLNKSCNYLYYDVQIMIWQESGLKLKLKFESDLQPATIQTHSCSNETHLKDVCD